MVKENVCWKFREWEELSISKSADRDPVHGKAVQVQSDQLLQMLYSRSFLCAFGSGSSNPFGLISFGKHLRCWTENQSFSDKNQ